MGLFSRRDKKKDKSSQSNQSVEHVVEVKTIGDITPVIETRKLIGDNEYRKAIILAYNSAKSDYLRYFSESPVENESNRYFFIRSMKQFGIEIPETGYVDNHAIINSVSMTPKLGQEKLNQFNALKKLAMFYLDLYEKAKFSKNPAIDGDTIVKRLIDIYNYMDIAKLYFPDVEKRAGTED